MGPSYPGTRGVPWPPLFRRIGQQGQLSGAFDGRGQDGLVRRTVRGDTAGENLAALRDEPAQTVDILVVNGIGLLAAKCAFPALGPPPTPLSPALRPRPAVWHCLSPSRIARGSAWGWVPPPHPMTMALRSLNLERHIVFAFGSFSLCCLRSSRLCRRPGCGGFAIEESDGVGDALGHLPLLTVLRFVRADLQPPLYGHQPPFAEMLRHLLGQSSPGDDVDEVCATFALLVDEGAVDGQREAGHRLPAGDIAQFGIAREPPDQDNPVQHALLSLRRLCRTARGCGGYRRHSRRGRLGKLPDRPGGHGP